MRKTKLCETLSLSAFVAVYSSRRKPPRHKDTKFTLRISTPLFIFLFLFFSLAARADADLEFQLALRLYENLQYNEALPKFERLMNGEFNAWTTASYVFYAKTLLALNKPEDTEKALKKFLEMYPKSSYTDEARLTLSEAYYKQKNFSNAVYELFYLADKGSTKFYKEYSRSAAEDIAVNNLASAELRDILSHTTLEKQKPFIQLLYGKTLLKENKREEAKNVFIEIMQLYPVSDEKKEADVLYKKILNNEDNVSAKNSSASGSLIAVILPLSNNQGSAAAREILEGIKYAAAEFNKGRDDKIGLVIKDTEMKDEKISEIESQVARINEIKAVLGPVFSNEVRKALDEFSNYEIAIVSPTATDNDLTGLYENFFQANPNFSMRGKGMAQYIYYVENKRRVAVLNAIEGYSPLLASSFIEEFEKLGGRVVVKETYKTGSYNMAAPVSKIASHISEIEGIYVPLADKLDAPALLSQLVQSGLDLPLYGDQDWLNARGFESSPSLSNKLTFTSDYFIDYNNPDFQQFSKDFYNQTKMDLNRNILYGYDTAKFLFTILRNFSGGRDAVKLKIESGLTTAGFHNNISFDENRVNRFLNILRYRDGVFELVDEFKVNN